MACPEMDGVQKRGEFFFLQRLSRCMRLHRLDGFGFVRASALGRFLIVFPLSDSNPGSRLGRIKDTV